MWGLSLRKWKMSLICRVLACCCGFFFFLSTRFLKELLAVLGGKSSGLVILRELGEFACVNATFKKTWISWSCFYTRSSHLTLLTFYSGGKLFFCPTSLSYSVILQVCQSVCSTLLLPLLFQLPATSRNTGPKSEQRRDTWSPIAIRYSRKKWLTNFICMRHKMKSENENFPIHFQIR